MQIPKEAVKINKTTLTINKGCICSKIIAMNRAIIAEIATIPCKKTIIFRGYSFFKIGIAMVSPKHAAKLNKIIAILSIFSIPLRKSVSLLKNSTIKQRKKIRNLILALTFPLRNPLSCDLSI